MSGLPLFSVRLWGPFGPSLYVRFGRRTSFILKRTQHELFSERNGFKRVHRFMGWSWRWQPIKPPTLDPTPRPPALTGLRSAPAGSAGV